MDAFIALSLIILPLVLGILLYKSNKKYKLCHKKYSHIIEVDKEVIKLNNEKNKIEDEISLLKIDYVNKIEIYNALKGKIAIYDEEVEFIELGFYKPHFDFDSSEKYKSELLEIRQEQKQMLSNKTAIYCTQKWVVEGSTKKGEVMTNKNIKLVARAFNNECDAIVSNVSWNNITRMETRIEKAFKALNKLTETNSIYR